MANKLWDERTNAPKTDPLKCLKHHSCYEKQMNFENFLSIFSTKQKLTY